MKSDRKSGSPLFIAASGAALAPATLSNYDDSKTPSPPSAKYDSHDATERTLLAGTAGRTPMQPQQLLAGLQPTVVGAVADRREELDFNAPAASSLAATPMGTAGRVPSQPQQLLAVQQPEAVGAVYIENKLDSKDAPAVPGQASLAATPMSVASRAPLQPQQPSADPQPQAADVGRDIESKIEEWKALYFREAVRAIDDSNDKQFNFLIGPNFLTDHNPFHSAVLPEKFHQNDLKLVDEFYDTATKMVGGYREIYALDEWIRICESDILPAAENAILLTRQAQENTANELRAAQEKLAADGKPMLVAPQYTLPTNSPSHADQLIRSSQEDVNNIKQARARYDILKTGLYLDSKSILDFAHSPYAELKEMVRKPIDSKHERRLSQFRFASTAATVRFFNNTLANENQKIVAALITHLDKEVNALQQTQQLTNQGIDASYIAPIRESYTRELQRHAEMFARDLATFSESGRFVHLRELDARLARRKDEEKAKLVRKYQRFVNEIQAAQQRQLTRQQAEQKYKQEVHTWLTEQGPIFSPLYSNEGADKIIASGIGAVRFEMVKDKDGNTFLHYVLAKIRQMKNDPNPARLQGLMNIFSNLLTRGASVFSRNDAKQNAHEYALSKSDRPGSPHVADLLARAANIFHESLTWASLIKVIEAIPTCTPTASHVKSAVLEYSRTNEQRIANWGLVEHIFFNYTISAIGRLNEIARIGELLYAAQHDSISDRILEDGITSLERSAPKGLFNRSTLYKKLREVLQNKAVVYIPFTEVQLAQNKAAEKVRVEAAMLYAKTVKDARQIAIETTRIENEERRKQEAAEQKRQMQEFEARMQANFTAQFGEFMRNVVNNRLQDHHAATNLASGTASAQLQPGQAVLPSQVGMYAVRVNKPGDSNEPVSTPPALSSLNNLS